MALFTKENAALNGRKGGKNRWKLPPPLPPPTPLKPDLFSETLAQACDETLDKLRRATEPIARAQLARALRDLRETWHMATGKPKPGQIKDGQYATRRDIPR